MTFTVSRIPSDTHRTGLSQTVRGVLADGAAGTGRGNGFPNRNIDDEAVGSTSTTPQTDQSTGFWRFLTSRPIFALVARTTTLKMENEAVLDTSQGR